MLNLLAAIFLTAQTTPADLSFTATSHEGAAVRLEAGKGKATVVCFLGTECPMARLYGPRLSKLAEACKGKGVAFVGVMSNRQDSAADIREYAKSLRIDFPLIRDTGNLIANQYSATRTPEVFLLDSNLRLVYRGAIDDQYAPGVSRGKVNREYLKTAIAELTAGRPLSVSKTKPSGCIIGRVGRPKANPRGITYAKQISRVLARHCVECHRDGEIGPFALKDYDEIVGWADTMVEVIDNGRMPPWHADPAFGRYANARLMPEEDKQLIRDWVNAGAPKGNDKDMPKPTRYIEGWQLPREPDQIVAMRKRPFVVPADGVVEYQYFVVDPGFKEDKWITGAQVVPGNRSVVHHAIAFVRPPDGERFRGVGWLAAYVPGQRVTGLREGRGRRVPAGSKIVFQMHYTPNGTPAHDITRIGLLFGNKSKITHEVYTLVGINQDFEILPNQAHHTVRARVPWLPKRGELLGITPHMHYRGKSFRLLDQNDETFLLHVPKYDFNWQHTYELAQPMPLHKLKELRFEVAFDNSDANPFNPDPGEFVTWGDQTFEEMAVAFFEVAEPVQGNKPGTAARKRIDPQRQEKIDRYVKRAMSKLDSNDDGVISSGEQSIVMRWIRGMDRNKDGQITRAEVEEFARSIY